MDILEYKDNLYLIKLKLHASQVDKATDLRKRYGADLVLFKDKTYWILDKIIEADFKEINKEKKKNVSVSKKQKPV